jgi:hypothetical protein
MSEAQADSPAGGAESAYWTRPVERKSDALADLQGDCFEAMWSWATCGGAPPEHGGAPAPLGRAPNAAASARPSRRHRTRRYPHAPQAPGPG